jgi:hypothetical protein
MGIKFIGERGLKGREREREWNRQV